MYKVGGGLNHEDTGLQWHFDQRPQCKAKFLGRIPSVDSFSNICNLSNSLKNLIQTWIFSMCPALGVRLWSRATVAPALVAGLSRSVQLCVTRGARSSAARFVFRVMLLFSSKQRKVGGSCVNIQGFPRGGVPLTLFPKNWCSFVDRFIFVSLFIFGGSCSSDWKDEKTIFGSCCFDVS